MWDRSARTLVPVLLAHISSEETAPRETHHSSLAKLSTLTEAVRFHLVPVLACIFYTSSQTGLRGGAERRGQMSTHSAGPAWKARCAARETEQIKEWRDPGRPKSLSNRDREWNGCGF